MIEKMSIKNKYVLYAVGLSIASLAFPLFVENIWFDIIVKIREAVIKGDSGHLIISSAYSSIISAVLSSLIFLSSAMAINLVRKNNNWSSFTLLMLLTAIFVVVNGFVAKVYSFPWEPVTVLTSLAFIIILVRKNPINSTYFIQLAVVSVQVFFAFQWLNIMPIFSMYYFGLSDIPVSIKITGSYINSAPMLNFIGFSFFLPFAFAAVITTILFRSYAQNISIVRENYKKERELQLMKSKVIENRIYQEINLLAHDLKTPLVTIRGLNSLLAMSKDISKIEVYSQRIEGAVEKMNEMVSSFLYGSSRQLVNPEELINYIRAQIPTEDDKLTIEIHYDKDLPKVLVNKVRVVRAIINILENAIVAPYRHQFKNIVIEVRVVEKGLRISICDNGIGIAPAEMSRIWEIGYSTGKTSGLGLPFAKQIIEENDGKIDIESEVNKGTVVTVFFPEMREAEHSEAVRRNEDEDHRHL